MDDSQAPKQSAIHRIIPSFLQSREGYHLVATQESAIALPESDDEEDEGVQANTQRRLWTCSGIVKRWGVKTVLLWVFITSLIIGLLIFGICMAVVRPNRHSCVLNLAFPRNGLESKPVFGQYLGCDYRPFVNTSQEIIKVPIGKQGYDHTFNIIGNSAGSITIAGAPPGVEDVVYDFTVNAYPLYHLEDFKFHYPTTDDNGTILDSTFTFETPHQPVPYSSYHMIGCSKYSVTVYIPQNLKSLNLLASTTTHIQFSPATPVDLDLLNITVTSNDRRNLVAPHTSIRSQRLKIDAVNAWVVGSVSLVKEVDIYSSFNYGLTSKVDVYPTIPTNLTHPEPAILRTWSGHGNMSISYIGSASYVHRPIRSKHIGNSLYYGEMSLEYTGADFNGLLDIRSGSLLARGLKYLYNPGKKYSEYTHSVGDIDGVDRMMVKSSGSVRMWFPGDYLRYI